MKSILIFGLSLTVCAMFGQATFRVSLSSDTIAPGDLLAITFKLDDASGSNFKAPSLMGMKILGGPNQSSRMSMTNGKVEQSTTYTYYVTVEEVGEFLIGACSVVANGKTLQTQPIPFMAVDGYDTPAVGEEDDGMNDESVEDFYRRHGYEPAPNAPAEAAPKKKRKTIKI